MGARGSETLFSVHISRRGWQAWTSGVLLDCYHFLLLFLFAFLFFSPHAQDSKEKKKKSSTHSVNTQVGNLTREAEEATDRNKGPVVCLVCPDGIEREQYR